MQYPLATIAAILVSPVALASVPMTQSNGLRIAWPSGVRTGLGFAVNPINRSGLSGAEVSGATGRVLGRLQDAGGAHRFWIGTGGDSFPQSGAYDGLNSVAFRGDLDPGLVGLTQVWFSTATGQIFETDTLLNDGAYQFTMQPGDSTSSGFGNRVFIENILAHELGHALGFAHAGGMHSMMFYRETREQAYGGCDELRATRAEGGSSIRGVLRDSAQAPIVGQEILAVSVVEGRVDQTAITSSSGEFQLDRLEPSSAYVILAQPQAIPTHARSQAYAGVEGLRCGAAMAPRQMLGGVVTSPLTGQIVSVGTQVATCTPQSISNLGGTVTSGSGGVGARFGRVPLSQELSFQGFRADRPLRVHILSAAVGVNSLTRIVQPYVGNRFVGPSGWTSPESSALLPAWGARAIQIEPASLPSGVVPPGALNLDSDFKALVLVSEAPEGTTQLVAERFRCRELLASRSAVPPSSGVPPRRDTADDGQVGTACASVQAGGGPSGGSSGLGLLLFAALAYLGTRPLPSRDEASVSHLVRLDP